MHIAAVIGSLVALCGLTSAIQGLAPRARTPYHDPAEPMIYRHSPAQQGPPIDTSSFLQRPTRRVGSRPTSFPVLPYVPAATAPATTLAAAVRVPGSLLPPPAPSRSPPSRAGQALRTPPPPPRYPGALADGPRRRTDGGTRRCSKTKSCGSCKSWKRSTPRKRGKPRERGKPGKRRRYYPRGRRRGEE